MCDRHIKFINEIPRSIALNKEFVTTVDLHVFGVTIIVAGCEVINHQ